MPDEGDKQTQKIAEKTRRVLTGAAISEQRISDLLSHGELGEMGEEEKRDREEVAKAEIEENDPVNAVTRAAKNLEMTRHNLSMGAALNVPENAADFIRTTAGGQPLTSAALTMAAKQLHLIQQGKKDKEQTHKRLIHQIERLNEMLAELDEQIAQHESAAESAGDFADRLKGGEQPELDEDGKLKNKKDEKTIADYEKRTGKKVDRTDREAMIQVALEQQRYHMEQAADLKEWQAKGKELANDPDPVKIQQFQKDFEGRQITYNAHAEMKDAESRTALYEAKGQGTYTKELENDTVADAHDVMAGFETTVPTSSLAKKIEKTHINGGKNITPEYNAVSNPGSPTKTADNTLATDAVSVPGLDPNSSG